MPVKWMDRDKCITLLDKAVYASLATSSTDGQPYITPVNYILYEDKIYIHTGFKGKKLDNIRKNPKVCMEISESGRLYETEYARDYTMRYWCVLVTGSAHEISDRDYKLSVMKRLMEKYAAGKEYKQLVPGDMDGVNVIEISIDEVSGKASVDPR